MSSIKLYDDTAPARRRHGTTRYYTHLHNGRDTLTGEMNRLIDVHSHLWAEDWLPERWWESLVDIVVRENEKQGQDIARSTVYERYLPTYWDPDGEHLRERMAEVGIDYQVVFPIDWGLQLGEPETDIREVNQHFADLGADHDELITFATIDPRRNRAAEFLERALGEWGMSGLKLHPTAGFHLHDEETYRLLEVARDHDVPVLTDSGPISAPLYSKYSHPIHVDEVLVDFPDLDLIVAHMSLGWWRDLLAIADMKINTNLYIDISGWQDRAADHPTEFATAVRGFVDALGADRVHFGTDDPVFDPVHPKEEWVAHVEGLVERETEPQFTQSEVDTILGDGAATLLDC